MDNAKKAVWLQGIKAGILSFVLCCVFSLVLALLAKTFGLSENVLRIVNQALKIIAMAVGTLLSVKDEKLLIKALLGGVVFWVLSAAFFCILGGTFSWGHVVLDLVIALVAATVAALIKNRRR